jgi:hypothetical protein
MVEGFWIVQYEGMQGSGGGVAMFIKGKVFGGNLGTYTTQGNSVQARVMVRNFIAGIPSVVGITGDFELSIDGMVEGNVIKGTGSLVGVQRPGIAVKLSKRADIPTE